jgi:hypothetical protein
MRFPDALHSVIESRSGKCVFIVLISFIYIFLYIFLFYYLGVQISVYFFPEVLKIQQVFERVNFIMKFPKIICS